MKIIFPLLAIGSILHLISISRNHIIFKDKFIILLDVQDYDFAKTDIHNSLLEFYEK